MDLLEIQIKSKAILEAYRSGALGDTTMPEDCHPSFSKNNQELKLVYFTLPMSLNYQRDSYKLWQSALKTYTDPMTSSAYDLEFVVKSTTDELREKLIKYKLALQPNKQINTWKCISTTLYQEFGSLEGLFEEADHDFLQLKEIVQEKYKKGFPYISGPKIFNYWSYIIQLYGGVQLKSSEYIDIAPDTHVTKASVRLGVITEAEINSISKERLSAKWREILDGTGMLPIDMHSPLWFWSRGGFRYKI